MHRKREKWGFSIVVLSLFFFWGIGLLSSAEAQDGTWLDLSDVNPVGKTLDHVEAMVPGLTLKGFLRNSTRMPLMGSSNNDSRDVAQGILGRRRNWDFDAIEWQAELEMRYKPSPDMELVVFLNQQYDSVFDWDHYWRAGKTSFFDPLRNRTITYDTEYIEREKEFYHSTRRWLREAYGNFFIGPLTLTVGKQQTVWGKIDFEVIDIVNPKDRRIHPSFFSLPGDGRWRRIPTWATKALYTFGGGNYYVEGTWIPDYERDDPLPTGWAYDVTNNPARWPSPVAGTNFFTKTDKPSASMKDSEWFFRMGFNLAGWDGFLFYGNYWSRTAATFRRANHPQGFRIDDRVVCANCVEIERKPTRLNSMGLALDKTFWFLNRNWTFIYESEYRLGQYFPVTTRNHPVAFERNPEASLFAAGFRNSHTDGVAKRPFLNQGIEFETFAFQGKLSLIGFFVHAQMFGWDGHLAGTNRHRAVYVYAHTFTWKFSQLEDRLRVSWTERYRPNDGSLRTVLGATYVLSDYLSASANVNLWRGGSGGNINDGNDGLFEQRDLIDFRFNYNF